MYKKPVMKRFGSFRDLTQTGGSTFSGDGFSLFSPAAPVTPIPPAPNTQVSRS